MNISTPFSEIYEDTLCTFADILTVRYFFIWFL